MLTSWKTNSSIILEIKVGYLVDEEQVSSS